MSPGRNRRIPAERKKKGLTAKSDQSLPAKSFHCGDHRHYDGMLLLMFRTDNLRLFPPRAAGNACRGRGAAQQHREPLFAAAQQEMVEGQLRDRGIRDSRSGSDGPATSRFVRDHSRNNTYVEPAAPIGQGQRSRNRVLSR